MTVAQENVRLVLAFKGDANLDGSANTKDSAVLGAAAAKLASLSAMQTLAGDTDVNGKINTKDAALASAVAGKMTSYDWDVKNPSDAA